MSVNFIDLQTNVFIATKQPKLERSKNSSLNLKNRQTIKKKLNTFYQISNKNTLRLFTSSQCVNSFEFDKVEEGLEKQIKSVNRMIVGSREVECKVLMCHNFQNYHIYNLAFEIGKKLISEGVVFMLYLKAVVKDENSRKGECQIENNKEITFISELKKMISLIKQPIQCMSLWFICPSFQLAIFQIQSAQGIQKILNRVQSEQSLFQRSGIAKNWGQENKLNINVTLQTIIDGPSEKNMKRCEKVLNEALEIKEHILKGEQIARNNLIWMRKSVEKPDFQENWIVEEPQSVETIEKFRSKTISQSQYLNNQLKQSQTQPILSINSTQTRKNTLDKPIANQQNHEEKRKMKKRKIRQEISSSSSQSESQTDNDKLFRKQKLQRVNSKIVKDPTNLVAENMHLKWQLKSVEDEYKKQAEDYVKKMTSKVQNMKDDRSMLIQENAKLKKDNQELLQEFTKIKLEYEGILMTRSAYEENLVRERIEGEGKIKENFHRNVMQLEDNLKLCTTQKQTLEKEVGSLRLALQDSRARNRERVKQLLEQIDSYKGMCCQMKQFCEQLERDYELERNRCENLQKRCKRYKSSNADLWRLNAEEKDEDEDEEDIEQNVERSTTMKMSTFSFDPQKHHAEKQRVDGMHMASKGRGKGSRKKLV